MKRLIAVCLIALPFGAAAEATLQSIQDCERVKNDLAYNQCLASFGPQARSRPAVVGPGENPELATPANPRRYGGHAGRRGRHVSRGRHKASFAVASRGHKAKRGRSGRRHR